MSASTTGRCAALAAALLATGCVMLPMHVYVADPDDGVPVYESCSFNSHVPVGVKVQRPGLRAIVSIVRQQGRGLVRVQYDVPEGTTLVLRENTIVIDGRDGTPPRRATFANVNPAAPARYPETPAIQKLVLPVDTPLRGGRLRIGNMSSDKHYWIGAPFDGELDPSAWVTLPEFTLNDVPSRFDSIHFRRRFMFGFAVFNC